MNKTDLTLDDFRKDPLTASLQLNFNSLKTGYYSKNEQLFLIKEGIKITKEIIYKYGKEKTLEFALSLKNQASNNSKEKRILLDLGCSRRADGTVNYDDCNFFEFIQVAVVSAFACNSPGVSSTPTEIEAYYNCVQEVVCKNC